MKISVLGSGGWGTALALVLLENGHDVTLWSYHQAESDTLRTTHENPLLKGVVIPEEMKFTCDLAAVKGCGLVVMATPSFAVRSTAAQVKDLLDPGTIVVSVSKGIEKDSSLRLSQVIQAEIGDKCPVVVLSGPSHAEEVGRHIPTGVVAAASTRKTPHTTSAIRQSIMMAITPPERMPLPPLKWNIQGNICPSRQNRPPQYLKNTRTMA